MGPIDKQTLLNTHYLFRDLEPTVLERIAALGVTRELAAEEVLFLKGDPANCVFIDDRELNVKRATLVGIRPIHYQSPEQLRRDLQELRVEPH